MMVQGEERFMPVQQSCAIINRPRTSIKLSEESVSAMDAVQADISELAKGLLKLESALAFTSRKFDNLEQARAGGGSGGSGGGGGGDDDEAAGVNQEGKEGNKDDKPSREGKKTNFLDAIDKAHGITPALVAEVPDGDDNEGPVHACLHGTVAWPALLQDPQHNNGAYMQCDASIWYCCGLQAMILTSR